MNRFPCLIAVLSLGLLFSCGDEPPSGQLEVPAPENLLTKEKMIEVMIETQLLEAKIADKRMRNDEAVETYDKYEKEILSQRGLDSALYYENYDYYLARVETFKELITAVTDSLQLRKEQIQNSAEK